MECILRKTKIRPVFCKTLHTSCGLYGWRQTGQAMKKVLGASRKKKIYLEDSPKMPSIQSLSKGSFDGKRSSNSRRATVLNKLFMRHITDQLATGSCSSEVLGYGVEINRVRITPDYKILNVYWLAKGTVNDENIEKTLQRNSGLLRHELSQLRLMGSVPIIQFVKDKHFALFTELDQKLSIADFGEDHVPVDPAEKLKTEFEILSPLNEDLKQQLKKLDTEAIDDSEELPLPPMPQNVLGLNHADILERIKKSKQKSEAPHRMGGTKENAGDPWVTFKLTQPINENPIKLEDDGAQRAAFKEFLLKRQVLKTKMIKDKNNIPDIECIREELRNRSMENLNKFDIPENHDEDFIDEDVDDIK